MRICHKNMLFLPSFSIPDMSVGQLERAATTPFRWIALSSKDRKDDIPSHSTRRIRIDTLSGPMVDDFQYLKYSDEDDDDSEGPISEFFGLYLVPGGRYLVTLDDQNLSVLDLGCTSDKDMSSDSRLARAWSTKVQDTEAFDFHPTPDGLGIRMLMLLYVMTTSLTFFIIYPFCRTHGALAVFEIYPQSKNPNLVRIAEINYNLDEHYPADCFLYGDRAVFFSRSQNIIIIWDFVANTIASTCVRATHWHPDRVSRVFCFFPYSHRIQLIFLFQKLIRVTETAFIILDKLDGLLILIYSVPPLITRTPLFDIHRDIQQIVPIFAFKLPEIRIVYGWLESDCWYRGVLGSLPLYLRFQGREGDMCSKLEFSYDLSHMSATLVGNAEWPQYIGHRQMEAYRICEDSFTTLSQAWRGLYVTTASDSSQTRSTYSNATRLAHTVELSTFCPVSARLVYIDSQSHIVISDFCC
jgi:hypothetical protein